MFHHQNERQIHNVKISNGVYKYVEESTHLGALLLNEICIYEEIRNGQGGYLGKACYHYVENLLSSRLSKNVKIKIYKIIIVWKGRENSYIMWNLVTSSHREIGWSCMDNIHLAQDRGQWLALMKRVTSLRVP
ncbi:hypothetical protein B7P43_G13378 [Cryptotermes secundus]|uniref:Uncharacterized protein n=1 Tax=Cryptotermes secundus TaxID=105785 RepID=A0A2J7QSY2_9NEOP|nr:hypothetical protein B7P43_G13378 [Cryptotermes secundus]